MFLLKEVKYKNILDIPYLQIEKNKITSILGESGSGKTTLIRLLNKLISCNAGEVEYNGKNLKDLDAVILRRSVVMLPQTPTIFPGNIRDNLLKGLLFAEKELVDDEKLLEILKVVHLNKGLYDESDTLSGGEKQRLALGRILLLEPEVLLLDEPSSALDENTENLIIEKLSTYAKNMNSTLIMVTHSKNVALKYSGNIVILQNGKVLSQEKENI